MHINAAMSDCSPPGVSQMSVNIQLFPLHLTLISLWWHFISPALAALVGKRSEENCFFVLFNPAKYKKMQIETSKNKYFVCLAAEARLHGFFYFIQIQPIKFCWLSFILV